VADLNLFSELARMRRAAPLVPARRLLRSATVVGADVLGLEADHGTIEPGRRADLIAVALPPHLRDAEDVEEYLLTGIAPEQVSWIDAAWTSGAPDRRPQDA
jgi:imidazolonepropionase-like amidohydrolase